MQSNKVEDSELYNVQLVETKTWSNLFLMPNYWDSLGTRNKNNYHANNYFQNLLPDTYPDAILAIAVTHCFEQDKVR